MIKLRNKIIQLTGKARRFVLSSIFRGSAYRSLKQRRGDCNRCGACCKLVFKCPAYIEENCEGYCSIYEDRPGICALYPINNSDLNELEKTMPTYKCGYYFVREELDSDGKLKSTVYQKSESKSLKGTFKIFTLMIKKSIKVSSRD